MKTLLSSCVFQLLQGYSCGNCVNYTGEEFHKLGRHQSETILNCSNSLLSEYVARILTQRFESCVTVHLPHEIK